MRQIFDTSLRSTKSMRISAPFYGVIILSFYHNFKCYRAVTVMVTVDSKIPLVNPSSWVTNVKKNTYVKFYIKILNKYTIWYPFLKILRNASRYFSRLYNFIKRNCQKLKGDGNNNNNKKKKRVFGIIFQIHWLNRWLTDVNSVVVAAIVLLTEIRNINASYWQM